MATTFPVEKLAQIAYSIYPTVLNKKAQIKADRKVRPWLDFLSKREGSAPVGGVTSIGINGPIVKYQQTAPELSVQGFERRDQLAFSEATIELETQFPWANVHSGQLFVHEDVEAAASITVVPNQARGGKSLGKVDSGAAQVLVDYYSARLEAMDDKYDIDMDAILLSDNSGSPKLPQGLAGLMPLGASTGWVNTGTLGTKPRSSSVALQHYVFRGATTSTGGTLRAALTTARRNANLRLKGLSMGQGGVDFIMAGQAAIDGYVAYATLNNIQFQTSLADRKRMADIGIPDTGISFEGIPIVHNPTFEDLDNAGGTTTWTKSFYLLNSATWRMCYAPGKKKTLTFPHDPADFRISRVSLDSKCVLIPEAINANAVVVLA